ncbi:auxin efflux carrier family [Vigna unguiculata]|uniref:Auxin efflux carrier family n=1 Tax=Vigna unguiculata TaxID=3917 RepID=A0A4D6LVU5_VIGUN|nr:auxin efflux carrier family [Vigna unguiculata]
MISLADVYHVVTATVPLYVTMVLAYISVKWWKLFTPEQCSGINKFVANFSVPILSFQVISSNNIYKMSLKLVYADCVQKLLAFLIFTAIIKIKGRGGLKWIITGLSLSTLPNTLILGIPLMKAMYRDEASLLLPQVIFLQSMVWYNLLLFLHELDAAIPARTMPVVAPPSQDSGEHLDFLDLHLTGKEDCVVWWGVDMPDVVNQSIEILASGGLGMATFSLGLFMASNNRIIACGPRMTMVAMGLKFLVGPAIMAVASIVIGLRDRMLKVAIIQAALPQGIVPFVFAREYNVHPGILSTGVLLGMLMALPVALTYYVLLSLCF